MDLMKQVQENVDLLSQIGSDPTGGMTRLLYSKSWLEAQQAVKAKLEEIGMETRFDGIGNLFGRIEGSELPEETILSGSHIDTVVNGGTLDGQFGVIAAYLAVQYLVEKHGQPRRSLEVISMAEEEGSRFPTVFWGSKNFVNEAKPEDVKDIADSKGVKFVDAMRECGFDFIPAEEQKLRDDIKAFIEIHIEQGNVLENEGLQVGVVNSIAGQRRYTITLSGQANHAGTTPMGYRKDTVYCFSKICSEAIERAKTLGDPLVLTFGKVEPKPNTVNVVPGETLFTIDCRHTDNETLKSFTTDLEAFMTDTANEMGIDINIDLWMDEEPVPMDEEIVQTIEKVVKEQGMNYRVMHSGAGHDAQIIAPHYPTAMIFTPSINGISHNPAEETKLEDLVEGVKALAGTLYELAY
ncbi:allantoate deiminase [Jeotgalibaca caeni]|uniref:allantoate deiminase n=1 Tax=Jeotgalibaca caeni TaxID=3028623 RepID=UPI00237D4C13|nr:allantoate deiminase [Jeotgalibaca caeni]MDE1547664.1 allantoate deiminase [Jeotgalibaca caeni]